MWGGGFNISLPTMLYSQQRRHDKRQSLLNATERRKAKSKLTPETKCKVMAHINPPKLYYTKENTRKTPQLACQAKGLCRALPVHACWCTCSCRVAAVQCQRGTCPCKATVHHLTCRTSGLQAGLGGEIQLPSSHLPHQLPQAPLARWILWSTT